MNLQTLKAAHSIYKEYVRETAVKLPLYGPSWPRALALVVFCFLSETIYQSQFLWSEIKLATQKWHTYFLISMLISVPEIVGEINILCNDTRYTNPMTPTRTGLFCILSSLF